MCFLLGSVKVGNPILDSIITINLIEIAKVHRKLGPELISNVIFYVKK